MALTPTQRDFVTNRLGVQPKPKGFRPMKSSGEKTDIKINEALDDYLRREGKVLEAITELRKVPANEDTIAALELELAGVQNRVKAAQREGGAKVIESAFKTLDDIKDKSRAAAEQAKTNEVFYVALDQAAKLLATLEKHVQRGHVAGEIGTATTELATARSEAKNGRFPTARDAAARATTACTRGKDFADRFALFVPKRADAGRIVNATKPVFSIAATWQGHYDAMVLSNAKADPPTRAYDTAEQELATKVAQLKTQIEAWYVTPVNLQIAQLAAKATDLERCPVVKAGESVIAPDIVEVRRLQTLVESDIAASKWGQAIMTARGQISSLLGVATKTADRRLAYDAQRVITVGKIDALKAHKSLLGHTMSMQRLVERADGLASRAAMRMEDGIAELKRIDADCAEALKVAADAEAYRTERGLADTKFAELQKLPAAANMNDQIAAIRGLLTEAEQATGAVTVRAA